MASIYKIDISLFTLSETYLQVYIVGIKIKYNVICLQIYFGKK